MKQKEIDYKQLMHNLFSKKNWLFFAGLGGILLIFLSDLLLTPATKKEPAAEPAAASSQQVLFSDYEKQLEQRLYDMLSVVAGAGQVQVMVTLENTGESIYAQNEQYDAQTQDATLAQRRVTEQSELVILSKDDTGDEALVQSVIYPQVKGVAVLCQGADDVAVVKRITELVAVVLDIPTNRVCVEKMT